MNPIFSKKSFENANAGRKELCVKLSEEIARRIHEVTAREFAIIAEEMKDIGHGTKIDSKYNPEFAAWALSSNPSEKSDEELHLRFYYDSQVSSWYD